MNTLLAAVPGRWDMVGPETVWWQATHGGRSEFLELREHATLVSCAVWRTRDDHVAATAPQIGLTSSRAARLFDALVERGLIVAASAADAAATNAPAAIVDATHLVESARLDAADSEAARSLLAPGKPGARRNAQLLAHAGAPLRFARADEPWQVPSPADLRIAFAREALAASTMQPGTAAEDPAQMLGQSWSQVGARMGVASETLTSQPWEALAHWREQVPVRAVVGGTMHAPGWAAPQRASAAIAEAAPLLALDARTLVPFALFDDDTETCWQVTALEAMHGRGSVLALPLFRAAAPIRVAPGVHALLEALAEGAAIFASQEPTRRFLALAAFAGDLADADTDELARALRRAALSRLARELASAPEPVRAPLRERIAALDDAALDIEHTRRLAARIALAAQAWPALWQAAVATR